MGKMDHSRKVSVRFESANDVKKFVDLMSSCKVEAEFVTSQQKVDAASLMGVFSLDVTKPLQLKIKADTEKDIDALIEKIGEYLVK